MSTILDALRKAKQEPLKDNVDAGRDILSGRAHNYLAQAPDSSEDRLRLFQILALCFGALILVLAGAVLYLILRNGPEADSSNNGDARGPQSERPATGADLQPSPTPETMVAPIWVPSPTPTPSPRPTPRPVSISVIGAPEISTSPTATPEPTPAPSPSVSANSSRDRALAYARGLRMNGVLWDPNAPMAMINGEGLREGDRVGEALVKKIHRSHVVVEIYGEEVTLSIGGGGN